jgi:predicted molibdopterin-dependent oxidoreductase YjgC
VTDPEIRGKFEAAWHTRLPDQPGLTTTEMVDGILGGQVKGWYVMGENPLMSEPDLNHARHAIEHLEFFVAQDIFFNETNVYADVILPAASFAEKNGTFTNSDRRVQRIRRAISPPGKARADWEILADLAQRTIALICQGTDRHSDSSCRDMDQVICEEKERILGGWIYVGPSEIWEEMRRVTPEFFGITYGRIEREGGVHWPCPDLDHPGSPYLFAESFPRGRGKFWPVSYGTESELPDDGYPFILSTGRLLYHWHGGTLSRASTLDDIWPECTVEMHPNDVARLGLETGDWVDVGSRRGAITARLLVTGRSPEGTVFIPFHFAPITRCAPYGSPGPRPSPTAPAPRPISPIEGRSKIRCSEFISNHDAKPDHIQPQVWEIPEAGRTAHASQVGVEGPAPQHVGAVGSRVLPAIRRVIGIGLVKRVAPLPHVAGHIPTAIGTVSLG